MESLSIINSERLSYEDLIRIGDVVNFEGSLMTLFQHRKDNSLYIIDWVDRDETTNRWLIYQIDAYALNKYLHMEITHAQLFESLTSRPIFVADVAHGNTLQNTDIRMIAYLPSAYHPEQTFFDPDDCPSLAAIKKGIVNSLSSNAQNTPNLCNI
ncbi:hypothetical protein [Sphingobacterium bambusae]|uniref:Uncharacterized protein n=1 Tax=Sphingobacterium bambusae TaxID=662858 RepID=A0ABW6BKE8_9SPHI|nr:hypothetical protein [Sphingobacterium bambusae]WPL47898.1 hypothetical protein SCB77_18270 [Sphingobacterium bambusae]